ncbi:MAG: acetolactate synthase large subunit [Pseudoxanthomonas suwonensis]|nr:acetolactate synthase large subunit [Pseudoxanthomonas suwonensis]
MTKASDLFVAALEAEGVREVFGVPGEENLDLIESLRTSSIRLVLTRHEQAAGFIAATLGRLTGKPGVCLSTLGPGATNLVTAAAHAQLGAMPMVMITGQKPVRSSEQGRFQIIDTIAMFEPLTKFTRQLVSADGIPAAVREAFNRARDERPGAVHLELPEDIAADTTDAVVLPIARTCRPVADDATIAAAAQAIGDARHPLLMLGAGANRKRICDALCRFAEHLQIPFFTTQMGKGVLDEDSPLWLGCAALSKDDFVHRAIDAADCIINVGHDVVEKPPFLMREGRRTVIHVNYDRAEVDAVYFPQLEVVGDVGDAITRLTAALQPQSHWNFEFFHRVRDARREHADACAADERFPMRIPAIVAGLQSLLGPRDRLCLDNGLYKLWFARDFRCRHPNTLLLDNALATMGAGLPAAIAARLHDAVHKVVAVCGDGGFMMNAQELETAVRLRQDLVVLVLRDDAYGMIKWKQAHDGFPLHGMDTGNPDFVRLAECHGAHGHRVTSSEAFQPLLRQVLEQTGVHVIEVPIDYSDDDHLLNHAIPARARTVQ